MKNKTIRLGWLDEYSDFSCLKQTNTIKHHATGPGSDKTKTQNKIGLRKLKQFNWVDWMIIQTPTDSRTKQTNIKKKSRKRSQYKTQHKNNVRQNKRGNGRINNHVQSTHNKQHA